MLGFLIPLDVSENLTKADSNIKKNFGSSQYKDFKITGNLIYMMRNNIFFDKFLFLKLLFIFLGSELIVLGLLCFPMISNFLSNMHH